MLIQQHGQQRNHNALHHIQGSHAEEHKGAHIAHAGENAGAHGDDAVQGHMEQLGELGQQVHGVESAAEYRHADRADGQTHNGTAL